MRKAIATISFLGLGLALFAVAGYAQQDKSKRPKPLGASHVRSRRRPVRDCGLLKPASQGTQNLR